MPAVNAWGAAQELHGVLAVLPLIAGLVVGLVMIVSIVVFEVREHKRAGRLK